MGSVVVYCVLVEGVCLRLIYIVKDTCDRVLGGSGRKASERFLDALKQTSG